MDDVLQLAEQARCTSLVSVVLRQQLTLTLAQLDALLREPKYGPDLAKITVEQLLDPRRVVTLRRRGESVEHAIMRVFRSQPDMWLSSGFFTKHLQLPRWTAQSALARLAERGLLKRRGKTSGTQYRLASGSRRRG